jgi:trehalose/maltose hydrolase-like predicted phosphorylase
MATILGFVGFRVLGEELAFDPILPENWRSLAFRIQWRGRLIHVQIDSPRQVFQATLERGERLFLRVNGEKLILEPGRSAEISFASAAASTV